MPNREAQRGDEAGKPHPPTPPPINPDPGQMGSATKTDDQVTTPTPPPAKPDPSQMGTATRGADPVKAPTPPPIKPDPSQMGTMIEGEGRGEPPVTEGGGSD